MRRIDWYLFREILGPMTLGFLVYTFILLMQFLFSSAEMIIQRGLDVATVGKLMALILPSSVVLTIPMSLLFGILIAVGRLSSDSELVALRSCGVSLLSLYRPVLVLSACFALLNTYLMIEVLPNGNHTLQQLNLEILTKSISRQVQPRVFYEEWQGKILYVFDIPPGDARWHGVFLASNAPGSAENEVIVADWGQVNIDEDGERVVLHLENATTHKVDPKVPGSYNLSHHQRLATVLEDSFSSRQKANISASKSVREMNLRELRRRIADPQTSPEMRNLARVQVHKSFAIPLACLVFGLVALPLGFTNRRGSKASGFALSLGVILVYWVLLNNGEEAARYGKTDPALAMWLPNVLFAIIGVLLLVRRNRDKSLMLFRIDRWIRLDLWRKLDALTRRWQRSRQQRRQQRSMVRRTTAAPKGKRIVVRLPRLRLAFPNLIDRYIIQTFVSILLLVLLSGLVLYTVADLGEKVDEILKNRVPNHVVLTYYKYLSLQIIYDISPIVVLVTTLITFSLLSRNSELTAFKASGVSLFRLSIPALVMAAMVSTACIYLQSEVLPASNQRVAQLKDRIRGRETARTYRRADRQWLFGQGRYVYNYADYDEQHQVLSGLQVFEFDDQYHLSRRLYTRRARYDGKAWIFEGGWARAFDQGQRITFFETFEDARISDYRESPDYFSTEVRPPDQMSYPELQDYIAELEHRGQAVPELKVQLYNKIAFPVISLVMALVALPFAFRMGRQGALYSVGLSIVLGMVFMAVYVIFSTLGQASLLPPIVAVWSPSVVFATLALYLFLGVKT